MPENVLLRPGVLPSNQGLGKLFSIVIFIPFVCSLATVFNAMNTIKSTASA
jgi:hypothetical protein